MLIISILMIASNCQINGQAKKFVVLVGISNYINHPSPKNLTLADDDARNFAAYFKSDIGGNLSDKQIGLITNEKATKKNIITLMNKVFSQASANDMIIFYFSGHGTSGAFCPTDTDNNYSSLLSHAEIKSIFRNYKTKYKILIADACHAGSMYQGKPQTNNNGNAQNTNTKVLLLMSSQASETSQEKIYTKGGVFTRCLLEALKGKADKNNDKIITLSELFPFVKQNTIRLTEGQQTPFIEGNVGKGLIMGRLK